MANWDAGSIGSLALNMIDNVPDQISGSIPSIVESKAQKITNYNGAQIDITNFDAKFMPAILNYTLSEISSTMDILGADAQEIIIGDFEKKSGKDSNVSTQARMFEEKGDKELDALGRAVSVRKAFG